MIDFQTIKENKYNDNGKKFMSNNLLLINNARIFFSIVNVDCYSLTIQKGLCQGFSNCGQRTTGGPRQ